jgi:CRISPR-associated protein (TIGR02584 family)
MRGPGAYSRRVLLAVTGLSPQVVTETVYALAVGAARARPPRRPFLPTEIQLATTREGAARARRTLLRQGRQPGWLARLRRDYQLPPIRFSARDIHILGGLNDIRCPEDNERLADALTQRIRALTADPRCALHVSIAGGRKTMGFYAGYALSLYARPQDRLSHVLVSPPFEDNTEFFYPAPRPRIIRTQGRRPRRLDASQAEVWLAEMPFVRMRQELDRRLLSGGLSFSRAVDELNRALAPPRLDLAGGPRQARCGGRRIGLPPADWALLAWFAQRAAHGLPSLERTRIGPAETAAFLAAYARAADGERLERARRALCGGMDPADFDMRRSRLHAALRRRLGAAARAYEIQARGRRPDTTYGLELAAERIRLEPADGGGMGGWK